MECPQCGLVTPEGSIRCDCGFGFETKGVDSPTHVRKTIRFSSSIGSAAEALWVSFGFCLLFVTAAWAYARQYRWIAQSLQLSDGTTARFVGNPKKIWFLPITFGLFHELDRWLTGITYSRIDSEAMQMILSLVLILGIYSAETVVVLKIQRWIVSGISLSSGTVLHFDGDAIACFWLVFLSNVLVTLFSRTHGLILLATPMLLQWSTRWVISHIHSERSRLRFGGSLPQMYWRTLVAVVCSIPLLTIPAVQVWLYKWAFANIRIEAERSNKSVPIITS